MIFSSLWSSFIHFISDALFLLPLTLYPSSLFFHLFVPWHHLLIFSFHLPFFFMLLFSCLSTYSLFKLCPSAFVCASVIIQSDLGFIFVRHLHLPTKQSCTVWTRTTVSAPKFLWICFTLPKATSTIQIFIAQLLLFLLFNSLKVKCFLRFLKYYPFPFECGHKISNISSFSSTWLLTFFFLSDLYDIFFMTTDSPHKKSNPTGDHYY